MCLSSRKDIEFAQRLHHDVSAQLGLSKRRGWFWCRLWATNIYWH